ncbi:hypothetical protein [Nostoc punctiforme]|nr:hypothetical protein [Nostoc punctiforme]
MLKNINSTAKDIENKHIQFPIPNSQLNSNIEAIAPESMQHSEVS